MSYKIISLNTWGGQKFSDLQKFISEHATDTDVFCFQEVFHTESDNILTREGNRANLFAELSAILPNHHALRAHTCRGYDVTGPVDYHIEWGIVTFVSKKLQLLDQQNHLVFEFSEHTEENYGKQPRNTHIVTIQKDQHQPISVANFHGIWKKGFGKNDCHERLQQSKNLIKILESQKHPILLTGDFNLNPQTESLAIIKQNLRDLIAEHGITSTRSSLYTKPERYADYAFASPELNIESFDVPQNIVASDHLPLIIKVS